MIFYIETHESVPGGNEPKVTVYISEDEYHRIETWKLIDLLLSEDIEPYHFYHQRWHA